ncbi:hypothetical protein [Lysobacter fragariae]
MSLRRGFTALVVVALLAAGAAWFLRTTPTTAPPASATPAAVDSLKNHDDTRDLRPPDTTVARDCPMPLLAGSLEPPRQSPVPAALARFRAKSMTLTPLAGFSIDARVLSRRDYDSGRESEISPTDLALGWGRMRDDAVLAQLQITQSGRWFHYRYQNNPPIPTNELTRSASNMHMVPADAAVADALDDIEQGDRVRLDGWLVKADAPDGWEWRSSTTRDDTGQGACELVYVCAVTRFAPRPTRRAE